MTHDNVGIIDESVAQLAGYFASILADQKVNKAVAMTELFEEFSDYLKANVVTETDSISKGKQSMPQVNIFTLHNVDSVKEIAKSIVAGELTGVSFYDVLMGHARLSKRDGETDLKAFNRLYEGNVEFWKADRAATEAGWGSNLKSSYPAMMETTPVTSEVGSTLTADDSYKAADQLKALVDLQRSRAPTLSTSALYERVYADPANKAVVQRAHRRPTASSTSGDELQR